MTVAPQNTVLVRRCPSYDRVAIERVVSEGIASLDVKIRGRTFVKPNVVFAGERDVFGGHSYTHPAFVGGSLLALSRAGASRLDLGENSAIGFPTRHCYRHAGYVEEIDGVRGSAGCPLDLFCIDEDLRDTVKVGGRIHDTLRLSRTVARADTKVYLPKLKCHCVSRMTGAVKLNIGICCDDDRRIGHDFRLDQKIVDLLAVGWPDLIVLDAIEVGVGNEAFPTPRPLGLIIMGRNPLAVDLVGARLLGLERDDVPYLKTAVQRGYRPASLAEVTLAGDLTTVEELDLEARRLLPHDEAFTAWQDIERELDRLRSPIRFIWGPHRDSPDQRCGTGCAMGLKMFLASFERYAGAEAFASARPVVFVVGRATEEVDAMGGEVVLVGKCATASSVRNARKVIRIDRCMTTARDLTISVGGRLGMPAPTSDLGMLGGLVRDMARSSMGKLINLRYAQDLRDRLRKKD